MSNSAPPQEAVSVLSQTFHVDVPCPLSVDVPGAHTRLRPASADEQFNVEVSVTGCSPEEAKKVLRRMGLNTRQQRNTIHIYSNSDPADVGWWRWVHTFDATLHVDLRLPARVEADIHVPSGAVDIADLGGHVDVEVMGGRCQIENLSGTLDLRAESSDVSIQGFSGDQIVAQVAVGTLTLKNVDAETLTVRAAAAPLTLSSIMGATTVTANNAPVNLKDLSGPCMARVRGGPLRYDGTPDAETELQVVGSSLETLLPADHGADLRMSGSALALDDRFPFDGERTDKKIEGTLNGGGPSLSLDAIGGSVDCQPA